MKKVCILLVLLMVALPAKAQLFWSGEKKDFVASCKQAKPPIPEARCPCMFDVLNEKMTPDQIQFIGAMMDQNQRKAMLLMEKHGRPWAETIQPMFMSLSPLLKQKCGQ